MNRFFHTILVVSLLIVFAAMSLFAADLQVKKAPKASLQKKYVEGEIIVKFKSGVKDKDVDDLNLLYGAKVKRSSKKPGKFKVISFASNKSVEDMVAKYEKHPLVVYAEPNSICTAFAVPNDPYYSPYQWHFDNPVYGGIHMESAWNITAGSSSVLVGILDSGVAYENYDVYQQAPDLAGTSFVAGYDFINNDAHANDDEGHGTHVCGTIAQTTNNNTGVAGIAYNCTIMPIKVLDSEGSGTADALADGLYFAADNGCDVVNMSLGWPPGYNPGATVENACAYAYNNGVTLCAATGNDETNTVSYPAAFNDYCIAVGATRYDEAIAYYSNTGADIDVVAPGGDVTIDQNGDGYVDGVLQMTFGTTPTDFSYYFYQGTSMATPHVTAVAALLISNGTTGPANVRAALENTAEDHGAAGWDSEYGWGLIDAYAALNYGGTPVNHAPVADAGGPYSGTTGEAVQFDGSGSGDPDGDNITYLWTFGDGATSTQESPSHVYASAGTYTVTLVVNDGEFDSSVSSTTASISDPGNDPLAIVSDIALNVTPDRRFVVGNATVTVVDDAGAPLANATVYAHWSGVASESEVIVTDASGQASCSTKKAKPSSSSFIFTIDDVVKSGYVFDSASSVLTASIVAQASTGAVSVFPNPANPSAKISFQVAEAGMVDVAIYNMIGQKVRQLVTDSRTPGMYEIMWDGTNDMGSSVVSGVYFVSMRTESQNQTIKLLLTK